MNQNTALPKLSDPEIKLLQFEIQLSIKHRERMIKKRERHISEIETFSLPNLERSFRKGYCTADRYDFQKSLLEQSHKTIENSIVESKAIIAALQAILQKL